jgi:hypothetical protein
MHANIKSIPNADNKHSMESKHLTSLHFDLRQEKSKESLFNELLSSFDYSLRKQHEIKVNVNQT